MLGINRFSDLTFAEFQATFLMPPAAKRTGRGTQKTNPTRKMLASRPPPPPPSAVKKPPPPPPAVKRSPLTIAPLNVDWRNASLNPLGLNAVTPVKFQGYYCGELPTTHLNSKHMYVRLWERLLYAFALLDELLDQPCRVIDRFSDHFALHRVA